MKKTLFLSACFSAALAGVASGETITLTGDTTWDKAVSKDAADVTNIGGNTLTIGASGSGAALTSERQFGTLNVGEGGTLKLWSNTQNYGAITATKPAATNTSIDNVLSTINLANNSKIYAEDGSYYLANVSLQPGATATYENKWRKAAVFDRLTADADSTFIIQQNASTDEGTTYVSLISDNSSTFRGTMKLIDNASTIQLELAIAHSDALASAQLNSGNNNKCVVSLNNTAVNLRALSGSGKVKLASEQHPSTLTITGTDNASFSGTLQSGVKLAIAANAQQTLAGATIDVGVKIINEGTLTLSGINNLSLSANSLGDLLLYSNSKPEAKYESNINTGLAFAFIDTQTATISSLLSGSGSVQRVNDGKFALSSSTLSDGTALTIDESTGAISFTLDKVAFCGSQNTVMQYGAGAKTNDVTTSKTIIFNGSGTLKILDNAVFNANSIAVYKDSTSGVNPYLGGSGTYIAKSGSGITNMTMATGNNKWTGEVLLTGAFTSALNMNSVGQAGSTIHLKQVSGSLAASETIAANIKLTNDSGAAAKFTNIAGSSYTFTGDISGTGNFLIDQADKTLALTFSGDMSKWTSQSGMQGQYAGMRVVTGTVDISVAGDTTGDVSVAFNSDSYSKTDNNTGVLNLRVDRQATFTNRIQVNKVTVSEGKAAIFRSTDVGMGTLELEQDASLTLAAKDISISNITLSGGSVTLGSEAADGHHYKLTTNNLAISNTNNTINANLVLTDGAAVTLSSGASVDLGCSLTLNGHVSFRLSDQITDTQSATLMTGVDELLIGSQDVSQSTVWAQIQGTDRWYTSVSQIYNSDTDTYTYTTDLTQGTTGNWMLVYDATNNGALSLMVPEPATASLSLLALVGLCSRRRRKA